MTLWPNPKTGWSAFSVLALTVFVVFYGTNAFGQNQKGKTASRGTCVFYEPPGLGEKEKHVLVIAISPTGSAYTLLRRWKPLANKHRFLVAVPRAYRAGADPKTVFAAFVRDIEPLLERYEVDPKETIVSGFADGATAAHTFALLHPDLVGKVIVDNGAMPPEFREQKDTFPFGKRVIFITDPANAAVYKAMQEDEAFLKELRWQTGWIERASSESMAPRRIYDQALVGGGPPSLETTAVERVEPKTDAAQSTTR